MLASFGGPAGLTAYARSLGDRATRLDRIETELNEAKPGDPRDTTTPVAMLGTMQRLLIEDALSASSRDRLIGWLLASKTGARRLRAGLPADWRVGDKTGTGNNGTANDIAIALPPGRPPILIAAYSRNRRSRTRPRNTVIAERPVWSSPVSARAVSGQIEPRAVPFDRKLAHWVSCCSSADSVRLSSELAFVCGHNIRAYRHDNRARRHDKTPQAHVQLPQ